MIATLMFWDWLTIMNSFSIGAMVGAVIFYRLGKLEGRRRQRGIELDGLFEQHLRLIKTNIMEAGQNEQKH